MKQRNSSLFQSKKGGCFADKCPLKRSTLPSAPCPQGLARARWTRDNVGYTEQEEASAPGCPYGILSYDADSYCFFKLMENEENKPHSDAQIAFLLGLTKEQVQEAAASGAEKLRQDWRIEEMKQLHKDGGLFDIEGVDEFVEFELYHNAVFSAESVREDMATPEDAESLSNLKQS